MTLYETLHEEDREKLSDTLAQLYALYVAGLGDYPFSSYALFVNSGGIEYMKNKFLEDFDKELKDCFLFEWLLKMIESSKENTNNS